MCPLSLEYVDSAPCHTVGKRRRTKPQRLGLRQLVANGAGGRAGPEKS